MGAGPQPLLRHRFREMIRKVYEVDPLVCLRCGGAMRVVAFITARSVIRHPPHVDHLASQGRALLLSPLR